MIRFISQTSRDEYKHTLTQNITIHLHKNFTTLRLNIYYFDVEGEKAKEFLTNNFTLIKGSILFQV